MVDGLDKRVDIIWEEDLGHAHFRLPYNRDFLDCAAWTNMPRRGGWWQPKEKYWRVPAKHYDEALELVYQYFPA